MAKGSMEKWIKGLLIGGIVMTTVGEGLKQFKNFAETLKNAVGESNDDDKPEEDRENN